MSFSFTDSNPLSGDNYYRVKYLDASGEVKLSNLKVLNFTNVENFIVQPNPSEDFISISNVTENTEYKICNLLGETVLNGKYKEGKIITEELSSGVYKPVSYKKKKR